MTLLTLAAAPARAEAPSIELGHLGPQVTIERALIEVRDEPRLRTARLVLLLTATHTTRRELSATIRIPAGARVTGFAYTGGGEERQVARPLPAPEAGASYALLRSSHAGALLEAAGADALALRAPIAADHPAELELVLALPPAAAIAFDPGGQTVRRTELRLDGAPRRIWDDLSEPRTIAPPRASAPGGAPALQPPAAVGAATSLLVGEAPVVVIGPATSTCSGPGTWRDVRRTVRRHHPQLRHCYMQVAQWNPRIEGTAALRFTIAEDGGVRSVSVDGDLGDAEIERCLAGEVARWRFAAAPGEGEVRVNYPLTFRVAR